MNRLFILCLTLFIIPVSYAQYQQDILGGDYQCRTIRMADDYEGEVVCTLIKKPALPMVKQAVLYIHGYNDYFFQKELGDSIQAYGYNFYALDLRKYGRSILPHQDPYFCKDLNEYFADIDTALNIIQAEGNIKVILMAHSTGGLICPLYLNNRKEQSPVDALILNSPFLDMNMSPLLENIAIPIVSFIGKYFPSLTIQKKASHSYAHSLLKRFRGEWEFNTQWKKINAHPKKAGWIHAIHEGHHIVQKGLNLKCPILVMSSDKSFPESDTWHDEYIVSDIVLDVADIQKYALRLGKNVSMQIIPNGKHDLILSIPSARDHAYKTIYNFLVFSD